MLDRSMDNPDAAHLHYLFDIPMAQCKPKLKIYCLKNNRFRKAMTFSIHEIRILKTKINVICKEPGRASG